ncbi:MAG: delta-60 repeat domain-containing protein, partial [candidate division SR1 bacterium]|nr:delta-60 repeat domain-containing protein [candidate division SR1 bacterium]
MQKLTWKFLVFIVIITGIFCYTQVSANITNINPSFDTKIPAGFDQDPNAMVIQSDGKIVIGGMFNSYQGITTNKIIRLNSDGTKDSSFIMGSGFNDMVWALALQSDGKIIVGGMFTNYSGVTANRIIRLNSDGTKDNTFNIGSGCNDMVKQIIIQSDGKIIVVGNFATYSGVTANRIIRLNSDGTKDNTFNIGTAFDMSPNTMTIQSDGKIIVVGNFATYSGITTNKIVRLNTDGTKDNTFNIGTSFDMDPNTIAIQSDGKIILGGNFSMYSGVTANKIIRLNTGGTKDNTFNIGTSFDMSPNTIAIQSDGKIMVGGMFSIYSGAIANKIIRLNTDGTKDNTFAMGIGFNNPVGKIIIQNDEKIFIQGYFTAYNGTTANKVVRLHSDGTKDTSFIIGNGLDSYVNAIAIQNDGKVIAGGQFSVYSGITANKIVRLNTDGTKDSTLNIGDGFNQSVQAITIQNDGKILVGGWFTTYSGVSANYITRLNSDGTKDNTFNIGNGLNGAVNIFALQRDGKIIVGG